MSVYGDFLSSFPELYEEFGVCKFETVVSHGYNITKPYRYIYCIKQDATSGINTLDMYSRKAGSSGTGQGIASINAGFVLWSMEDISLVEDFVVINNQYYKATGNSEYNREGGFYRTEVAMVAGSTDTSTELPIFQGAFE